MARQHLRDMRARDGQNSPIARSRDSAGRPVNRPRATYLYEDKAVRCLSNYLLAFFSMSDTVKNRV
jgi:hypothetical protein